MTNSHLRVFAALLGLGGLLLANSGHSAVIVSPPTADYHVRDLKLEDKAECDLGKGTWGFTISWTPRLYLGVLRMKYNVTSLAGSIHGPIECTAVKCSIRLYGMHRNQTTAYATVAIADIPKHSVMRIAGFHTSRIARNDGDSRDVARTIISTGMTT